jgi:predicted DCC family thiol-disulfide oxidoreductase YuxK
VRVAPLGGETFRRFVGESERTRLPDSIVLQEENGALLTRWMALTALLGRLGGTWGLLGAALATVPVSLGDRLYDAVARVRHRLFRRPGDTCPRVPPALLARFDP